MGRARGARTSCNFLARTNMPTQPARTARPRPNIASWEAFDADARQRIRQHVLDELGIDLEGGMRNAVVRCMLQGRLLVVRGFRRLLRRS